MSKHRTATATVLVSLLAAAGSAWAAPPMPSGDALADAFRAPPAEFRPLVIAHARFLGRDDATDWLAARHAGGMVLDGGVAPSSKDVGGEPSNNPTYLNDPGQWAKLRDLMTGMGGRGQHVWLYDELRYPSASAGGRVLADHPEFQVEVVGCRTMSIAPSRAAEIAPELGPVLACFALPWRDEAMELDEAVDLTQQARSGKFSWTSPDARRWSVCLFERFQPDTWRRHNIPRRNVNILDRRAVARFIELTHARYATELGASLAQVEAFFTDEPQFGSAEHWTSGNPECVPMIQWCDALPEAFHQKKGYDLTAVLPALFHPVGPRTSKLRFDFYDIQSDLVAENYFGQIEQWCHEHGMASTGHMLLEESLLFHVMFSGSMMKNWARMDLPGVDLLGATPYKTMAGWQRGQFDVPEDFSCKMASSVAHLTGKRGVFTESFALAKDVPLRRLLGVAAWQFSGGVTHMTTYTVQWELPADEYARLGDFVGRLAVMTRRGRHVADVAVLVPEAAVWAAYTPPDRGRYEGYFACNAEPLAIDRGFRAVCHALGAGQRDFDCLSETMLAEAKIEQGCLLLADEPFRVLVLPEARMMADASLDKVRAFAASGGAVVFVGSLPRQCPERGDDPQTRRRAESLLGEFPDRVVHLPEIDCSEELLAWITATAPAELSWDGPSGIRLLRRQEPDREIVLLANPGGDAAPGRLHVPCPGEASLWNPETGAIEVIGPVEVGQPLAVEVPPESARLVVIEKRTP